MPDVGLFVVFFIGAIYGGYYVPFVSRGSLIILPSALESIYRASSAILKP